uniref:RxLR effector candidate protein n=1 Tax=Peronospora matthiolae TaxID=2874970 RepID=A0AAV1TME7_9STRA
MRIHNPVTTALVIANIILVDGAALELGNVSRLNTSSSGADIEPNLHETPVGRSEIDEQSDEERSGVLQMLELFEEWAPRLTEMLSGPLPSSETIVNRLESDKWVKMLKKLRRSSTEHDDKIVEQMTQVETIENMVAIFNHLRQKGLITRATWFQRRLFEKTSAKERGAFIQGWLRAGMVPEDVLEIVGSSSSGRILWLQFSKLYWKKVGADPVVKILEQLRTTYPEEQGLKFGFYFQELMTYSDLKMLAESMRDLRFEELISKNFKPDAYSLFVGDGKIEASKMPVGSIQNHAYKAYSNQFYVEAAKRRKFYDGEVRRLISDLSERHYEDEDTELLKILMGLYSGRWFDEKGQARLHETLKLLLKENRWFDESEKRYLIEQNGKMLERNKSLGDFGRHFKSGISTIERTHPDHLLLFLESVQNRILKSPQVHADNHL